MAAHAHAIGGLAGIVSNWPESFQTGRDRFKLAEIVSNWPGSFHHGWGVWNVER
jgi:hypothetical protein